MTKHYPKVLIIGHVFHNRSGSGITLTNLFKEWPCENLAVAVNTDLEKDSINIKLCKNYYFLGNKEIKVLFPFNLIYKIGESNEINFFDQSYELKDNDKLTQRRYLFLKSLTKTLLKDTGLNSIRFSYSLSDKFEAWIRHFNPDIIYSAVGDLDLIFLLLKIKNKLNFKIAIHIWDDWPHTLFKKTYFPKLWSKIFYKSFSKLVRVSDIRLSISEYMAADYSKKYYYEFIPFHNPVNFDEWLDTSNEKHDQNCKKVFYFGKINDDTIKSLKLMAAVVEEINLHDKINIYFHILSRERDKYKKQFNIYKNVIFDEPVEYSFIPSTIKNADVLFLPLDFSSQSIEYTRLSIPTKLTEYMISGIPALVLAHPSIALNKFTKKNEWALLVESFDKNELKDWLLILLYDQKLRNKLTSIAQNVVRTEFNGTQIRENFRKILTIAND